MAEVDSAHGRLDGLVNNAGVGTPGDVEQTSFADWRRVMAINADGVFLGCKYAMPLLARSKAPSIVNISSASGIVGGANLAAYNASKGAVRMLTKSWRCRARASGRRSLQFGASGIHRRRHGRCHGQRAARSAKARAKLVAQMPIGRLGPAAGGGQYGGVAAVAGLLVHDRLGSAGRWRPDRWLITGTLGRASAMTQHLCSPCLVGLRFAGLVASSTSNRARAHAPITRLFSQLTKL